MNDFLFTILQVMGFQEGIFLERFAMAPSKFTFIMEKDLCGCFGVTGTRVY